jgi:hypothetical protein
MDDPEFAERVALERRVTPGGDTSIARAKAEIVWQDRKYAKEQEESRRSFELALADKQPSRCNRRGKGDPLGNVGRLCCGGRCNRSSRGMLSPATSGKP